MMKNKYTKLLLNANKFINYFVPLGLQFFLILFLTYNYSNYLNLRVRLSHVRLDS